MAKTRMPVWSWLIIFLGLLLGTVPGSSAAEKINAGCESMSPEAVYARLKAETFSHNGYTTVYSHRTERGKNHEVYAHLRMGGKYLQKPAMLCETRLSIETSFPEQAGVGEQECYSEKDDLTRILMPGAYRALGVITMFPEDPKANYLNGENTRRTTIWTWLDGWDKILQTGKLSARCEQRKGKPLWVLILDRSKNPDPVYNHSEERIWVDPELWFPIRVEKYVPNDPKPAVVFDFEQVIFDDALTEKDVTFEGVAPRWSLVSASGGPRLSKLAQQEPVLQDQAGLEPGAILAMLDQALAAVKDYATEITLELRYRRLRQYRRDQFLCIRERRAFSALTTDLEANYMQINSGERFRTVYDPTRDNNLHVLPAGIYKFMGEQLFPPDDPRLFTAMGDNVTSLNFFAIRDELAARLSASGPKKSGIAGYGPVRGIWLEATVPSRGIPACPASMRILLDEKTRLPLRLEYRGYDDPNGYLAINFSNTRINPGLKSENLWK